MTTAQMQYALAEALPDVLFGQHGTNWSACSGGESYGYFDARAGMSVADLEAAVYARYPGIRTKAYIYRRADDDKWCPPGFEAHSWRCRG